MFIDFAHQYEAMLDVLLILGRIDVMFLRNGCDELIGGLCLFILSHFYFVLDTSYHCFVVIVVILENAVLVFEQF